jgi:carboxypeptidase C (cathepsin A)
MSPSTFSLGLAFLAALVAPSLARGPNVTDIVKSLPYYSGEFPSPHYSGYLDLQAGESMHYYMVLAETVPVDEAPVIFSFSGGPLCSSMMRVFMEQGPFRFNMSSPEDDLTVSLNPHRWTATATIVFVEMPLGVGFSYSESGDYTTNDNKTADDNLAMMHSFFKLWPGLAANDVYISGESYAGIYVPTLAYRVAQDATLGPRLKGVLVGNGVTDNKDETMWNDFLPFVANHGIISRSVYEFLLDECYCPSCVNQTNPTAACAEASANLASRFDNIDIYNIYSPCATTHYPRVPLETGAPTGGPVPCIDSVKIHSYLNLDTVRTAIHVTNTPHDWYMCYNYNYTSVVDSVVPIYSYLMERNIRILIFSGMQDASVPYVGTETWVTNMNLKPANGTDQLWRQWNIVDGRFGTQVAGYVSEYVGLTFATVLRAGHMVPRDAAVEAYAMFDRFMSGNPL